MGLSDGNYFELNLICFGRSHTVIRFFKKAQIIVISLLFISKLICPRELLSRDLLLFLHKLCLKSLTGMKEAATTARVCL